MPASAPIELDAEYRQLREEAGYLPRVSRRLLAVAGADAVEYLQGQLTNDLEALAPGQGCYAALLDRKGHMQADMRVLLLDDRELWLELEAVALEAALGHLQTYKIGRDVTIADRSDELASVSVIGPAAEATAAIDAPLAEHDHREIELGGARCRAVGGDGGVDLHCERHALGALEAALQANGAAEVSEAAAEIIRVEHGRPRFGAEMGPKTIPAEAGIVERAVDFEKGCYIGQETVARLHYKGKPNRHLRGLRLSGPAGAGDLLRLGDREVGAIGTACLSPALGQIGLAIVRREASPGDELAVGEGAVTAQVVELPFSSA